MISREHYMVRNSANCGDQRLDDESLFPKLQESARENDSPVLQLIEVSLLLTKAILQSGAVYNY